jgi:wyosine [tRNA(Phe)-imidazoG37] synthetase (radical SAM superfamily)
VYRLTLVKGYNAEEIENYARLVELGQPDFIEIKGVTFCGSSKGKILFYSTSNYIVIIINRYVDRFSLCSKSMKFLYGSGSSALSVKITDPDLQEIFLCYV